MLAVRFLRYGLRSPRCLGDVMKVSELLALRIENATLKLQILQTQATAINAEQMRHIEEARTKVGAPKTALFNTDTREFQEQNNREMLDPESNT